MTTYFDAFAAVVPVGAGLHRAIAAYERLYNPRVPAPTPAPKSPAQRVSVIEAAIILGLPPRTVQDKAARGELPGAAKIGRNWSFDREKLHRFVRQKERETWRNANPPADVFGEARFSGGGSKFAGAKSDGRFTQVIQRLRERATKSSASD